MTQSQDIRFALFVDENRILIVSGQASVLSHNGPVVVQPLDIRAADVDHGLDGQGHSRHQTDTFSLLTEVRDLGILMKSMADSMADKLLYDAVAKGLYIVCNGVGNIKQMIACYCFLDSLEETLTGHVNELLSLRSDLSYRMGSGCIGMHALVDQASVDADDITLVKDLVLVGDGMNYFVIYGNTKGCRITVIIQEIRDASQAANRLLSQMVKFPSGDARPNRLLQFFVNNLEESSGFSH